MTQYSKYFLNTYRRKDWKIRSNKGSYIKTEEGIFLDMVTGLGVNAIGGLDNDVINAIHIQLEKYMHLSNFFESDIVGEYAKCIVDNSFAKKIFFSNSGTETVEGGLKLIKKYGNLNNKHKIIVFKNGFHGRSLGSLSITAQDKYQKEVNPLLPNIIALDFNDLESFRKIIDRDCAGVVMEVIQGEGGINIADYNFLREVRKLTKENKSILFLDEIQTGIGRTGKLFAFEHYDISPDIVAISKALGGGLPLGALLVSQEFTDIFEPGDHGSTFGGNPVSCAAGLATFKKISDQKFLENVEYLSHFLEEELIKIKDNYPHLIGNIKIKGLMVGIELLTSPTTIQKEFENNRIFVNITQGNILRLLPPLNISQKCLRNFCHIFNNILSNFK